MKQSLAKSMNQPTGIAELSIIITFYMTYIPIILSYVVWMPVYAGHIIELKMGPYI